ncbi:winged helix DNA-binding domain-containing protein [Kitasatospora sp. McL0602]|uniref:winged helix DNA-binding domain-containing protein n=1 Tax=Kitasatospora sp. McL0602 TaxID=3439530 RepID=UPI003F8AE3CA
MTGDAEILRWRMHAQFGPSGGGVAEIARRVVGVQAQDAGAVRLGLRARGLRDEEAVGRAAAAGEAVSSWLMRGTLHLVAAADLRPMVALFGERNAAAYAGRRRQLGLTEEVCRRALAALPEVLADGPLGRAQLIAELNERGAGVDPKGQAPAHLVMLAAARGLLHRGADVGPREPGYVLTGPGAAEPMELGELVERYVAAFGPAGPEDFAGWSALPLTRARREFERAALREVAPGQYVAAGTAGAAEPPPGPPLVRLLGAYDGYLLGYRDRALMLDQRFAKRINAGGGQIRPAVVADGRVLGTWRRAGAELVVEPFAPLPAPVRSALAAEAAELGCFLGSGSTLRVAAP